MGIWLKCRLGLSHLDCKPDRIELVSTVRQPSGQGRVLLGSTVPAAALVLQLLSPSGGSSSTHSSPVEHRSGQLAATDTWDPGLGKKPCAST